MRTLCRSEMNNRLVELGTRQTMIRYLAFICIILFAFSIKGQNRLRQEHLIHSTTLSEDRIITVSLPSNYEACAENYGVLYILDGEYAFDYAEGSVAFLSNAFGHMPPLIVVSVPNIDRARDMYVTYNDEDDYVSFLNFIAQELMLFVNQNYRTNGFDILYGWSSASNINMQFLATNAELFDAHIQSGTGIGSKTSQFFLENLPAVKFENAFLYAATEGHGSRVAGHHRYEKLINDINPVGLKWKFELITTSSHVGNIADGIHRGLQYVFENYYIPDSVARQDFQSIMDYYTSIDTHYNFEVVIPVGAVIESAGLLFHNKKPKEAIRLLEYGMKLYPYSHDISGSLGEIYEYLNDRTQAAKYYNISFQKSPKKSDAALKYDYLSKKMKSSNKKSLTE